jgi:hypothetical protein
MIDKQMAQKSRDGSQGVLGQVHLVHLAIKGLRL